MLVMTACFQVVVATATPIMMLVVTYTFEGRLFHAVAGFRLHPEPIHHVLPLRSMRLAPTVIIKVD